MNDPDVALSFSESEPALYTFSSELDNVVVSSLDTTVSSLLVCIVFVWFTSAAKLALILIIKTNIIQTNRNFFFEFIKNPPLII